MRKFAQVAARVLLSVLLVHLSACAPLVISNSGSSAAYSHSSGKNKPTVNLIALANFGYGGNGECWWREFAKENRPLYELFTAEIAASEYFDLKKQPHPPEIDLEACLRDANDAHKMEGVALFSFLTFGLIPIWYSRDIILEVKASSRTGRSERYTETNSYTAVHWLPLTPFTFYWDFRKGVDEIGRRQFQRVLLKMERDGFFSDVPKTE
jgi:hypothetical protein